MNKTIHAIQHDTVAAICWREYGRTDVVEAVLQANPGLSAQGPVLNMGTAVYLPEITTPQQTKQTVQLWE